MTATEDLRHMLDERGVEWWNPVQMEGTEFTRWCDADNVQWTASEVRGSGKLRIGANFITPEQAIAVTLGAGTCHITVQDNLAETDGMGDVWLECDACHWQMLLEPSTPRFNFCPSCGARIEVPE